MKASQIQVGSHYVARVSGRLVTVRVDGIREVSKYKRNNYSGQSETRLATVYDVTNLQTGRKLVFQSAAKFRYQKKEGLYHPCNSTHPATCSGCHADESKHGQPIQVTESPPHA